jgi:hypothetical protein
VPGKKFQSGTATPGSTAVEYSYHIGGLGYQDDSNFVPVDVTGLTFLPSVIVAYFTTSNAMITIVYVSTSSKVSVNEYAFDLPQTNIWVTSTTFRLPLYNIYKAYTLNWRAFE